MIVNMIISLFIATCLQWNPQSIAATISKALITGILSKGATTYLDPDDITIQLNGDVIGTKVYVVAIERVDAHQDSTVFIMQLISACILELPIYTIFYR